VKPFYIGISVVVSIFSSLDVVDAVIVIISITKQEGLAVASIARDVVIV